MARYISLEGLPALGKSELLSVVRLYFPGQVAVFPELVKEVGEREQLDPFSEREKLNRALLKALPGRQEAIEEALAQGLTVVEESHLGVHAAYSAALGDHGFLAELERRVGELWWPDRVLRLEAPLAMSLFRQEARGEPRWQVDREVLRQMAAWLSDWHARRGDEVVAIAADQPPERVLASLASELGLVYRSLPREDVIPCLILLGRPAAGKSELIQFLQGLPADERAGDYHLGTIEVVDDFPLLWEKFLEDDIWEAVGKGA